MSGNSNTFKLPPYEYPPRWIPIDERRYHPDYNNDLQRFMPRTVLLRRSKVTDALGFNIRGGKEHYCGIYISKVMPNTEAERLGLVEGDQILQVNDVSFEDIEHARAVKVLKSNTNIQIHIRYFPYGYSQTFEKARAFHPGNM